jgi:hypothetical protein
LDDKQIAKFADSLHLLQSVEGQLTNLKKRIPEATKDAVARHKALPPDVVAKWPHWKDVAGGLVKMTKPVGAAEKAVQAILKLYDKKKLAAMTVPDLKKKIQSFMPAFKTVSDEGVALWSAMSKVETAIGGIDPNAVGLKVSFTSYHAYNEYLNHFKVSLGKIV